MSRLLLCSAFVALAAATVLPATSEACGGRSHSNGCGERTYVHGHFHFGFGRIRDSIGFLDYRHSLDDSGGCDDRQDRRREYVFHRMSGREAYEVWNGGGQGAGYTHRHDNGWGGSEAHAITSRSWSGGGQHAHAWGVHNSDNYENH